MNENDMSLIKPYVTSTTANVFAIKGLDGIVGPAFARYSRAKGGVRDVLLREFIKDGVIDPLHANELIARILIQYGDDSVGELEGSHLCLEQVSVLFTKDVEDRRIGGSPIEQSTRYVFYDQKGEDGNWRYYRGEEILNEPEGKLYTETMDFIFDSYTSLIEPLKKYLEGQKPFEEAEYDINGDGVKEKWADITDEKEKKAFKQTYTMDLRTKACDILRALLPLATLTNVGLFGNGRYYQEMLSFLWTTRLPESHKNAAMAKEALDQVIPQYVKRAGKREYNAKNDTNMYLLADSLFTDRDVKPFDSAQYSLLDYGEEFIKDLMFSKGMSMTEAITYNEDTGMIAAMVFPYSNMSLTEIRKIVHDLPEQIRNQIWNTYLGDRENRRNRPGRALEFGYPYNFDLVTNFGVYKDLERHRMCSQQRQLFTTKLGYTVPEEIIAIGAEELWHECFSRADKLYDVMVKSNPTSAQYAALHGNHVRWTQSINDRAAMHMLELRTTPQGHPQYRVACQEMHKLIAARNLKRAAAMQFVDYADYASNRGDSEARQRVKEAELDKKLGKA